MEKWEQKRIFQDLGHTGIGTKMQYHTDIKKIVLLQLNDRSVRICIYGEVGDDFLSIRKEPAK